MQTQTWEDKRPLAREGSGSNAEDSLSRPSVFISYSRTDSAFADHLVRDLSERGFKAYLDKADIAPGEPWKERLGRLIAMADTIVFVMSPDSMTSAICSWEIEEAERLAKRIMPVVCRKVPEDQVSERLRQLNWIFMTPDRDLVAGFQQLVTGLRVNLEWIREHTRLGELARRWAHDSKPSSQLLRGDGILAAEGWAARRPRDAPELDDNQLVYIRESRALHERERKRERFIARAINVSVLTVLAGALAAGWIFRNQFQDALRAQSLYLADLAQKEIDIGNAVEGMLLAVEAVPNKKSSYLTQILRPHVRLAEQKLRAALKPDIWEDLPLIGHTGLINSALFSPDGTKIVTSSQDKTARIWDSKTGNEILILRGHERSVDHAQFLPDGTKIVTRSSTTETFGDGTARLWDTKTGKQIAVFGDDEKEQVTDFQISPDGSRIVTTLLDDTARLWNAATGQKIAVLKGASAAFSPDSKRVVTASYYDGNDKTAHVWDAATGREVAVLNGHEEAMKSAAFSPDSKRIVTASDDKTARLWDAATGQEIAVLKGHEQAVNSAAFSPDGKRIVTASDDKTARLWDAATGQEVAVLKGHEVVDSAAFSPDGKRIATTSGDQSVLLWNGEHFGEKFGFNVLESDCSSIAQFSSDGSKIVTVCENREMGNDDRKKVRLWDSITAQPITTFDGFGSAHFSPDGNRIVALSEDMIVRVWHGRVARPEIGHSLGPANSANFSSDGTRIITYFENDTARLWNAKTGQEIAVFRNTGIDNVTPQFSPDGSWIVTASSDDDSVWLLDAQTGERTAVLKGHTERVYGAHFSPDSARIITFSDDETARIWNAPTGQQIVVLKGHVSSARFSPDGRKIVTASEDGTTIQIWDAESGQQTTVFKTNEDDLVLLNAEFSLDGTRIITNSRDNWSQLWDAKTGKQIAVFGGPSGPFNVGPARFSPDGSKIITVAPVIASFTGARVWDSLTGQQIAVIQGHEHDVVSALFSPDGSRIVTAGSEDLTARIWNAYTGQQIAIFKGHQSIVTSAQFSLDGSEVVTASADKTARVWNAQTSHLITILDGHEDGVVSAQFSPDGTQIVTITKSEALLWNIPTTQTLVDQVIRSSVRCLTPSQRERFHLTPTPPRWCFELKKWPYHNQEPPPLSIEEHVVTTWGVVATALRRFAQ